MQNNIIDELGLYLQNDSQIEQAPPTLSDIRDEAQLKRANLMQQLKNVQQMQQEYGVPSIGDLFQAKDTDIQQTLDSVYHMMKQRASDIDKFQDTRKRY